MKTLVKFTNRLLGLVVLLVLGAGFCAAQSTATLAGTVTDPTGAALTKTSATATVCHAVGSSA